MADISKFQVGQNEYDLKDTTARQKLASLIGDSTVSIAEILAAIDAASKAVADHTHKATEVKLDQPTNQGYAGKTVEEVADELLTDVSDLQTSIQNLYDDDNGTLSIREIAVQVLTEKLIPGDAQEALNTLQEIADWIQDHPDSVAAINAAVAALQAILVDFGTEEGKAATTVKKYVDDAIAGVYSKGQVDGLLATISGRIALLESAKHTHTNKTVLDGITAAKVTAWDGKASVKVTGETLVFS